jgi:hypothetical protein
MRNAPTVSLLTVVTLRSLPINLIFVSKFRHVPPQRRTKSNA